MKVRLLEKNIESIMPYIRQNLYFKVEYTVLSLDLTCVNVNGFDIKIRVLSDDGIPGLYNINLFEITDSKIDEDFVFKGYDGGSFEMVAMSMSYNGFWEDFFNDDKKAVMIFKERFPEFSDKLF